MEQIVNTMVNYGATGKKVQVVWWYNQDDDWLYVDRSDGNGTTKEISAVQFKHVVQGAPSDRAPSALADALIAWGEQKISNDDNFARGE